MSPTAFLLSPSLGEKELLLAADDARGEDAGDLKVVNGRGEKKLAGCRRQLSFKKNRNREIFRFSFLTLP